MFKLRVRRGYVDIKKSQGLNLGIFYLVEPSGQATTLALNLLNRCPLRDFLYLYRFVQKVARVSLWVLIGKL